MKYPDSDLETVPRTGQGCPMLWFKIDLETLPRSMKHLKRERGIPVPWFVDYLDGKPEFRAMDGEKWVRAVKGKFCWVCGGRIHGSMCFVAGPMCGVNRTSSEPPSHIDCARWSARNCPFLANPRMVRREDEIANNQRFRDNAAGIALSRNPGIAMLWLTRSYEVWPEFGPVITRPVLIEMGEPESVEWWIEGRTANRAEVLAAVERGLPDLEKLAAKEPGGMTHLDRCVARFQKWVPAE